MHTLLLCKTIRAYYCIYSVPAAVISIMTVMAVMIVMLWLSLLVNAREANGTMDCMFKLHALDNSSAFLCNKS